MTDRLRLWRAIPLSLALIAPDAEAEDLAKGRDLAEEFCARCHAIGRFDESELATAPPFRNVAKQYSVWDLDEALAEGIVTGHPEMPEFRLEPAEIDDLLGYLATLETDDPD